MQNEELQDPYPSLAVDSIIEDLFGLNLKGLKSIGVLWARPKDYFDAASSADWKGKYTPSIRIWLAFFALFSALKFWWFGQNEGMIGAFAEGFSNANISLPDNLTYTGIGAEAVLWSFGLVPILQLISMILVACFFRAWGRETTVALRQRYLFAVLVPSASLMPVFLSIMLLVPQPYISLYGIALALLTFCVDFQAGYRGAFSHLDRKGRALRAAFLSITVVTLNTATAIAAQIAGVIMIGQKYGFAGA